MENKNISAQEIVKKFNISYHTLNYYTAMGLLSICAKIGNRRIYEEDMVKERLAKISELSREGYPLHLIRKKLVGI